MALPIRTQENLVLLICSTMKMLTNAHGQECRHFLKRFLAINPGRRVGNYKFTWSGSSHQEFQQHLQQKQGILIDANPVLLPVAALHWY